MGFIDNMKWECLFADPLETSERALRGITTSANIARSLQTVLFQYSLLDGWPLLTCLVLLSSFSQDYGRSTTQKH